MQTLTRVSRDHGLLINPTKSAAIVFGNKLNIPSIKQRLILEIDGIRVDYTDKIKNLGLWLDADMRFGTHVGALVQASFGILRNLYANRFILSQNSRMLLCSALVLSRFNYCDSVYGPCLRVECAGRIQRVQNACLRFVFGIRKFQRISHTLVLCKWLNMERARKLHAASLYHQVIRSQIPQYLYRRISFRTDVHHLNLRRKDQITVPNHRTALFKRSFSYGIATLWNSLPCTIKECSRVAFKYHYKKVLMGRQVLETGGG